MGWPGVVQGGLGGAATGAMAGFAVGGPPGAALGAGLGMYAGGFAGGAGGKSGLSKFGKKRAEKLIRADRKNQKKMAKFGLRQHKRNSREQMNINEEWVKRQQPIHKEALESQRKYQNRTAKKQIPINAKLAGLEDQKAYAREMQRAEYANELRIHNQPMREEGIRENRELFEKYGLPHKYENEKFYKKSLLTPEQQKNLAFQNKMGTRQKDYRDISKNPLFREAKGVLSSQLQDNSQAYQNYKAPLMQEFQEEILPSVMGRAGRSGQEGGHLAQAGVHAAGKFSNQLAALRQSIIDRALHLAPQYAGAETASRQQEIQNAQQNAQLGLGRQGFERMYKPSLYATPQGGTLAGGVQFSQGAPSPSFAGVGQAQYGPLNSPNVNLGGGRDYSQAFQQGGGGGGGFPGLNQFLSGAGQGAGTAAGNYFSDKIAGAFNGGSSATAGSPSSGANPFNGQGGFSGGGWKPM